MYARAFAAALSLATLGCDEPDGPSAPTPSSGPTATVRIVFMGATTRRTDLPATAQACVSGVGATHTHPSWRGFAGIPLQPVPPDRYEISFTDVPVNTRVSFRVNDQNACDENPTGAVTRNVLVNDVRLTQNTTTPGNGDEPGFAFSIAPNGAISQWSVRLDPGFRYIRPPPIIHDDWLMCDENVGVVVDKWEHVIGWGGNQDGTLTVASCQSGLPVTTGSLSGCHATTEPRQDAPASLNTKIAMRNFRNLPVKSRRSPGPVAASFRKCKVLGPSRPSRLAQLLPLWFASINVFRAALFSVVLTLAIGQNAGLLCTVWCPDTTSTTCPHQESTMSPSVRTDDTCTNVAVAAVAFVSEDGRRTAPAPDVQHALVVLRFRFVAPPTDLRPGYESGRRLLLEERPLVIALRI